MYMRSRVQDKIQVIALRMQGFSYSEIQQQIPVSKGLLSGWLKYVKLTTEQERQLLLRLKERSKKGVANAVAVNIEKRKKRELDAYEKAKGIYFLHRTDPVFVAGVCLYWAEGSKRTSCFQFVNSDPEMVTFMVNWVQKYLHIPKEKIALRVLTHADFAEEKYEDFWSKTTGIPLEQFKKTSYKPNKHGIFKKNPEYRGCVRVELGGGMDLLRQTISLYKILNTELKMLYSTM